MFVKVHTDVGIYGVGEASGWPRVVETAITDLTPLLIGEDPFHIERLWHKMLAAMMGHGMTGIVGSGAMTGIEMALWDIKGKAMETPVWNLLGGKMRDTVRIYAHAHTVEKARNLVDRGYTALKTGGIKNCVETVEAIRKEVGMSVDLMVDIHGPPWLTTRDAIALGRRLEPCGLLFYEDPVAPENIEAIARVGDAVDIPIAAIAEVHYVTVAPHDGSLGPVAEMAAVHLLATLPNFLILEHLEDDVPQRLEVMTGQPEIVDSHIVVPDTPGLGIDIVEEAIAKYPSSGNIGPPDDTYDYRYIYPRDARAEWLSTEATEPPEYRPGHVY